MQSYHKIVKCVSGLIGSAIVVWGTLVFAAGDDSYKLSAEDEAFLDNIQRKAFEYFVGEYNSGTGIVYDGNSRVMGGSIAAVGFALSSLCVADSRGWISHEEAYNRALKTLESFHRNPKDPGDFCVEGRCGLFFHFVDPETGRWFKNADCVSTADTADFIAGVITCMEYFKGTRVEELGDEIVRLCEWDSFLFDNKGKEHKFIAMGVVPEGLKSTWTAEKGIFGRYYGYFDNSFLIYLLGIGSPTHPIPASSWYACQATYKRQIYNGRTVITTMPPGLAFHYYQHCWIDLRNKKDQVADYFRNSFLAVLAQQDYCATSGDYGNGLWGLSSCISLRGYEALGAPFGDALDNGTVTPHAIAGGLVFTPKASLDALKYLVKNHGELVMGKYGLTDAFNEKKGWVSRDYVGIDQGVIVLMIENFRTGLIWKYFMQNRYVKDALRRIGFAGIIEDFESDSIGRAYSRFDISSVNASMQTVSSGAVAGKKCLKIEPKDGGPVTLSLEPELKDFSNFKYLSVWVRQAGSVVINLADEYSHNVTYELISYVDSSGWRRFYYDLGKPAGIDLTNIRKVVLTIIQKKGPVLEPVFVDDITLAYEKANYNPQQATNIGVSVFDDCAIGRVTFRGAADAHHYDIRYATKPIFADTDFLSLDSADGSFFANGNTDETFFIPLPGRGKYYIGVETVDAMGGRSDAASAGPVIINSGTSTAVLDDFERAFLPTETIAWPSHQGYALSITNEKASRGTKSLRVECRKRKGLEWDQVELSFRSSFDIRPFRYLKVDVYGEETVIAKLFSTKEAQEDVGILRPLKKGEWNTLVFDTQTMPDERIDKTNINKILFFIAPGRVLYNTVYIDNIRLDNSPG